MLRGAASRIGSLPLRLREGAKLKRGGGGVGKWYCTCKFWSTFTVNITTITLTITRDDWKQACPGGDWKQNFWLRFLILYPPPPRGIPGERGWLKTFHRQSCRYQDSRYSENKCNSSQNKFQCKYYCFDFFTVQVWVFLHKLKSRSTETRAKGLRFVNGLFYWNTDPLQIKQSILK